MIKLTTTKIVKLAPQYKILALSPLIFSAFFISQSVNSAESFQANDWQCQSLANGHWDCSASSGNNTPGVVLNESEGEIIKIIPAAEKTSDTISTPPAAEVTAGTPAPVAPAENIEASSTIAEVNLSRQTTSSINETGISQGIIVPRAPVMNKMWSSCALQMEEKIPQSNQTAQSDETIVDADYAETPDNTQINFSGNVIITKNDRRLVADKANYNKVTSVFDAQGNVTITQPGLRMHGDTARYQTDEQKGRVENAQYHLFPGTAQGVAEKILFKPGEIGLNNMTYSTCPADDQDWLISASTMDFYIEEGYGEGTHAVMKFKGVPFFYTPYIRFPINDERQSGFLMPHIGTSERNGFELATPYYFNIAPNQDATITPTHLYKRGVMLGGEYRYLTENYSVEVYAEWIKDRGHDEKYDVSEIVKRGGNIVGPVDSDLQARTDGIPNNRGAFSLQQRANWTKGWSADIDYNYVTDNYYIEDFGNNLRDKSTSHLLREGTVNYNGSLFKFMGKLQGYQEITRTGHTYSRLPQLTLSANEDYSIGGFDIDAGFDSEFVMFAQNWDDSKDERLEANRLHIKPYMSIPFKNSYSFITPKLSLDMISYRLENNENIINLDNDSPTRIAPIFSIDSGLFFDKDLSLFNTSMKQTLEPRLFYLNIPSKDQSDLPLFDTGETTFSFSQLFRDNRFNGADRLGDANQLTAAVTTRFIDDESGTERFKASIGQIYYFEDREVTLKYDNNGDSIQSENDTKSSSSIAAEVSSKFAPNWDTSYFLLYDPHNNGRTEESRYRLRYKSDRYHIANFEYSYRGRDYEQAELSTYWQIAPQWRALAHWYYSIYDRDTLGTVNDRDGYTLESKIGIEYESCCYAVRLIAGREQADYYSEGENSIMLQFQFKGLGSLAQGSGTLNSESLSDSIPGFEPWNN